MKDSVARRAGTQRAARVGCVLAGAALTWGCDLVSIPIPSPTPSPEPAGDFCGGIAGVACPEGFYCAFEDGSCNVADRSGACQTTPDACIELFDPVCGCDGETYANACFAATSGASIDTTGECP